jgi:hypothetical protein
MSEKPGQSCFQSEDVVSLYVFLTITIYRLPLRLRSATLRVNGMSPLVPRVAATTAESEHAENA